MKWQKVKPICSIRPALSRLALVQTYGGPSVMHESVVSVSVSSTPRYWCLIGEKTCILWKGLQYLSCCSVVRCPLEVVLRENHCAVKPLRNMRAGDEVQNIRETHSEMPLASN